jgi:hypothetical protein
VAGGLILFAIVSYGLSRLILRKKYQHMTAE